MANNILKVLTASENMSHEYCCTIVQIGELTPIEGSDFLAIAMVEGREIIVRKDQVKSGDILFYASNESELNSDFLSVNNMFEDYLLNANVDEVNAKKNEFQEKRNNSPAEEIDNINQEEKAWLSRHKGYFNKYGRVRMVKLRGRISMGFLFGLDEIKTWCPAFEFTQEDLAEHIRYDFDTINGVLFIKAFVPPIKERTDRRSPGVTKRNKALKKFNRMIPGQFSFHYDTAQLNREIYRLKPDDVVTISNKIHGTSFICGNILTKAPKWGGLYEKLFIKLPKFLQFTKERYSVVYSSRRVVMNSYITETTEAKSYYSTKVYTYFYNIIKDYIPEGYTIYGEIYGYEPGTNKMVQSPYDYKCKPGTAKLMIYRITMPDPDNIDRKKEMNVMDVKVFTEALRDKLNEKSDDYKDLIDPIEVFYHGPIKDLYPDLSTESHWHENLLERMKNDTEHFGMEQLEPRCRAQVPREGIVLRIDDDVISEAFKLKCIAFLEKESKKADKGQMDDPEMEERYEQEEQDEQ